jgi:glycosyltransferase involved in cell wall biosynthesis
MLIRYYSPLVPDRTGVADYSTALMAGLARRATVAANPAQAPDEPGAVDLYHIGNNSFHRRAYHQALARPGVAVIHDAVLQHFLLGSLSRQAYVEEFVYNYGEWHREFADALWRDREKATDDARYFEWPLLRRIAEGSRGLIVHNPSAAAAVLRHAPAARLAVIPHLFEPGAPPDATSLALLRASWGVSPGTLLVGVFGYLRETKRIPSVLRAFERARARGARLALLVAGEFVSNGLEQSLGARLRQPGIIRRGYVDEVEFLRQVHAVDVCANLRVPSAGESSGIATRLMGAGKAVFLSEGPEVADLPSGAYLPVSTGPHEEAELEEMLLMLAARPQLARQMGEVARQHILGEHSVESVVNRYISFLRACR